MSLESLSNPRFLLKISGLGFGIILCKLLVYPKIYYRSLSKIPGPKPSLIPFVGNLGEIQGEEDILPAIERWRKTYGSLFKVWYGNQPTVILTDPDDIKQLLNREVDINFYCKGYDNEFRPWLGDSILLSRGDVWKAKRKLMSPAFHHDRMENVFKICVECCERLVNKWDKFAQENKVFELHAELTKLGLDIVGLAAFNFDFKAVSSSEEQTNSVLNDFNTILFEIEKRSYDLIPLPNWFYTRFTSSGRKFSKAVTSLRSVVAEIVHKRRNVDQRVGDLLDLILDSENESYLTDEEIGGDVMTFLFAGHETTSTGVTWALYLLALHPEIEQKVYDEIQRVLGNSEITFSSVMELTYLFNVIQEALRLYPPQPAFVRRAVQETQMRGITIPVDTEVSIVPYLLHRDEAIWDRPTEFDPDRFGEKASKRHPFAYIPFSGGLRSCIGRSMALIELRVVLATILRNFTVKLDANSHVFPLPAVTLRPAQLLVSIIPRK